MDKFIWIGPRESDIWDCQELFDGSVTIFGSNKNNNISYCAQNNVRIDHNVPGCVENAFWNENIQKAMDAHPNCKIMYYNSEYSIELPKELRDKVVCCNQLSLLKTLADKSAMRISISNYIPTVPFQQILYSKNMDIATVFPMANKLIFQENSSSGGYGTHLIDIHNLNELDKFEGRSLMLSPYFQNSISVNVHMVIGNDDILYFPGSVQIIQSLNNKLLYLGADYIAFQTISLENKMLLKEYSYIIGEHLQILGYRGAIGFDFLITEKEIMFLEINARFQASTPLLNKALKHQNLPTIQQMHLYAFTNQQLPKQSEFDSLVIPYSMISYIEGTWKKSYSVLKENCPPEIDSICWDGFDVKNSIKKNGYLFKLVFNTNCTSINADFKLDIYENLLDIEDNFFHSIAVEKNPLETKISLLNQGVLLSAEAKLHIENMGKIRKAVFSAVDLKIFDFLYVNCPRNLKFSSFTPWRVDISDQKDLLLYFYDYEISPVTFDLEDRYCNCTTPSNIPFSRICFWATDRLRIHHNLSCCLKQCGEGCKFCEIQPEQNKLELDEVFQVIDFYLDKANTFNHFLIGGGSEPRSIEPENILKIVKHIREKSEKNIYVMSLPPQNLQVLKDYYEAGVTEIGFNIEIFNPQMATLYMPGKSKLSRQEYIQALKEATRFWKTKGKVRSLIIVGLEPEASLLNGIQTLCEIGVMPILSVYRPIPGTATENIVPPSNRYLRELYKKATDICHRYSLHLGPDCPACQNNTLSLPF